MTFQKRLPPVGSRPGTLAIPPDSPPPRIHLFDYRGEACSEVDVADRRHVRAHLVDDVIGQEEAEGRERGGELRDEDAADAELLRLHAGVDGPVAPEHHQRERPRVDAPSGGHAADGVCHIRIDEPEDARRGIDDGDPERRRHALLERRVSTLDVEPHGPARERDRVQVAEHQVRVGDRRLLAAAPVAHRPGFGAGALRSDLQRARFDVCDRATPRADRLHVHHREADQVAMMPVPARLHVWRPTAHQADVVARAAHVDGDEVLHARGSGDRARSHDAPRGTRAHDGDRLLRHVTARHDAAVRLHDEELAAEPCFAEATLQAGEVAADPRPDVGVHQRRARSLELGRRGHHLVRERDHHAGNLLGGDLAHAALVGGIDEGEEEDDGE